MKEENITEISIEIGILDYLESKILFTTKQEKVKEFFLEVVKYNKNKDKYSDFFEYQDELEKKSSFVKRTRLNKILENYQYKVNSLFEIVQLKSQTFEYMVLDAIKKISSIEIDSLKLFDSFNSNQKKYLYDNEEVKEFISNLIKNGKDVKCLSILNDNLSKEFYKFLYKNSSNSQTNFNLKFLRQPIILNSPIIFILIKDMSNKNYIFYFEEKTNWRILTSEKDLIEFSPKFYSLLNSRFDYIFNDTELENLNYTLAINADSFYDDFNVYVNKLINDMKEISELNNLEEIEINFKINLLIKTLMQLKISFPKMNYNYRLLYHFIRLLEMALLLKNDSNLEYTQNVLDLIINSDLFEKVNNMLIESSSENTLLLKSHNITKKNLDLIRKRIFTIPLNNKDLILDLFSNLFWNNKQTIIESFNIILSESEYAKKFVNIAIKLKNRNELYKYNDLLFYKLIARIIIDFYLCSNHKELENIDLNKEEIEILKSLEFSSDKLNKMYKNFIENYKFNEDN